jgi:sugar phosphate isomerase/epimerase
MNPLGMDYLTLYGVHPLDYVRISAQVGCAHVAFFSHTLHYPGLPPSPPSLFEDAALRADVRSCLSDHGLTVGLVDGFGIHRQRSVKDYRPLLDIVAELGAARINTASTDEWGRTVDEAGGLAEMAAGYGLDVAFETMPTLTVDTLPRALDLIRQVDRDNLKLMIDTMHISRSGGASLLADIDPDLISYVQLADAPSAMPDAGGYMIEALHDRMAPGEGELPLVEMLKCVPPGVIIGLECPVRILRERGLSDLERAAAIADGARKVMRAAAEATA